MFSSPVFLASVALSVMVYFSAWLAPEPLFSKAFAAALTVRLALAVGLLELSNVARACLQLYREAEAATTLAELEAAAERFGKGMGGTALRVMVLVASFGVGKGLPQVPQGGLGSLLRAPRYTTPEGLTLTSTATATVVADGTLIVTGTMAGTAASALGSACGDGSTKEEGYHWHHLATDKSRSSTQRGGPWTPLFEEYFELAGMSLKDPENLVYLKGHKGPHPEAYHLEVSDRLRSVLSRCRSQAQCRTMLVDALRKIAEEVCTPGTRLHGLATKTLE